VLGPRERTSFRRLLLRRACTAAAAAAAASAPARCLLLGPRWLLLELLLRFAALLLLLLLRLLRTLRLLLLWPLPVALALALALLLRARFLPRGLPGPLLEVADLLVHVAAGLVVLFDAELVVPAVRAAFPPLGIRFLTGTAEDAFWQRHRESARIVHFAPWTKTGARRSSR